MNDITQILAAVDQGDPHAAERLLPLVYDELRKLAAQKMAQEGPGQTLNATALVHEAYLRLVEGQHWNSRGHFFSAAAEAMRAFLLMLPGAGGPRNVAPMRDVWIFPTCMTRTESPTKSFWLLTRHLLSWRCMIRRPPSLSSSVISRD